MSERNDDASSGPPRWVKIFGAVGLLAIVVFLVVHLTGNSPHGRHGATHAQGSRPASPTDP